MTYKGQSNPRKEITVSYAEIRRRSAVGITAFFSLTYLRRRILLEIAPAEENAVFLIDIR